MFGVTPDHLAVLAAFVEAATSEEIEHLFPDHPGHPPTRQLVEDLLSWGLLLVVDAPRGASAGFGHIESHLPMVADQARVRAYGEAIQAHAKGKRVAEVGGGTGILSLIAARSGARSVFTVEESDIADVAEDVFRANDVDDRVQLVRANSFDVEPPEPVDLLIHEIFGVDPFEEGVLQTIDDARRRWLRPGGRLLPMGFTIRGCAMDGPAWSVGQQQVSRIRQLARQFQVDLEPVIFAGREAPTRRIDTDRTLPTDHEVRTEPVDLLHIDLTHDLRAPNRFTHHLPVRHPGKAGAFVIWFDIHLDETRTLSTSPFTQQTHWGWQVWDLPEPVDAEAGGRLCVELALDTQDASAQLEVLDLYAD